MNGGTLSAAEWNEVPSELQNVIAALGLGFSSGDLNQLGKGIVGYASAGHFYSESGVANAYVASAIGGKQGLHALSANTDGAVVRFRPSANNTGASTINVNGLGVKAIVRESLAALSANDITTTRDAWLRYRFAGDHFVLQDFALSAGAAPEVARGFIDGYITSRDAGDPIKDVLIGAGVARNSTDTVTMRRASSLVKQIDANFAVGTNAGGFPNSLVLTANTWYHVFIIRRTSDGLIDAGFDTSLIAANLLAAAVGFAEFRRIGAVRVDASSNILAFFQEGNEFWWADGGFQMTAGTGTAAEESITLTHVPPGLRVNARVAINFHTPTGAGVNRYTYGPGDGTLGAVTSGQFDVETEGDGRSNAVEAEVRTSTAQIIKVRSETASADVINVRVKGWRDPRGSE